MCLPSSITKTARVLPVAGSGQNPGEPLHWNLRRECGEELGIEVNIGELCFVREWIDGKRAIHQIELSLRSR